MGLLHDIAAERFCGVARRHYVALDIGGVAGEDYSRPVRFEREGAKTVTVSKGADSVDFRIVNLLERGDIVVDVYKRQPLRSL